MEGIMWQDVPGLGGPNDNPSLQEAQRLVYQAFDASDEQERVRLAKQALEINADCADAYVLLAEHARSRKQARELYEQGVAAGERALGPEAFQHDVGHFWGILATRPYMRAREGLALSLWTSGRREEAVRHLQEMLRLNPNDNQGVRYTLAGFLLFLDRDDDLARLLQEYPDEGTAAWAYTRALLLFRQQGDTVEARRLLKQAKKINKHVPAYLLGQKYPPTQQPGYYGLGDENEALNYVASFLAPWKSTAGAIAWLRANLKSTKSKAEAPHAKGPLGFIKQWLKTRLPQESDVWQADARRLPNWVRIAGVMVRPWAILVSSRTSDLVLAHEISDEEPSAALVWDTLVKGMQYPAAGPAHRPTELQVRPHERWESLRPHAEEIGIRLVGTEALDQTDALFKELTEHTCGPLEPGLLDMPGIQPAQVARFYETAADFFQQAPWKKVGYESAIKIECDRFESGPWYGVLMGQSGLTMGLALYDDIAILQRLWSHNATDEDNARQTVGTSVSFGEEWDIPVADLEAAERYGWKVARADAYPSILHKEHGLSARRPLAWELELMTGCLQAVPGFVMRHPQDDPAREEVVVPGASGELRLGLSWVAEQEAKT
jgi:tetratricopeptide (TPR) repeat protein